MYIILYVNSVTKRVGHITPHPMSYDECLEILLKLKANSVNTYTIERCL